MGKLSTAVIDDVMDCLFGGATLTPAAHHRIVLSSTEPQDDGTGITEPTVNAYAPVVVDNDLTTWTISADRGKSNAIVIAFPTVTDTDSADGWGDLDWFAVLDDDTDDYVGHGRVPRVSPRLGDTPTFDVNQLVLNGPGS